jgi:ATP-dependent RNA helicase RhlE
LKSFAELSLSPHSLLNIAGAGFKDPTPIQALAITPALLGRDVIGAAETGTGKTLAYLLPIIERLNGKTGTRALVLAPTRELALQIGDELTRFARGTSVRGAVVIGGVGMGAQSQALTSRHEVIIATPGRLIDHMQQGRANFRDVEVLVLDEADRMLDMGFKPQLTRILAKVPTPRQTLLFSATMGGEVEGFARQHLKDPVRVEVARSGTVAPRAEQQVYLAHQDEKLPLLMALLQENELSTLVFTRTKHRADKVAKSLKAGGHRVTRIHADRSQGQRRAALEGFKDGTFRVLVATDIAARGIDVAEIGHVVNFDLPHVPEDYVHRIGRTARASASGRASSFAAPEEADLLHGIEKFTRARIPRAEVPRGSPGFQLRPAWVAAVKAERPHGGGRPQRTPGSAPRGGGRPQRVAGPAPRGEGGQAQRLGSWKPRRR